MVSRLSASTFVIVAPEISYSRLRYDFNNNFPELLWAVIPGFFFSAGFWLLTGVATVTSFVQVVEQPLLSVTVTDI